MYSRHLVIEQGGTRALVTGMGATLALKVAGLKSWSTIGGISGGSIPAILMASKLNPLSSLEKILACDFSQLFEPSSRAVPTLPPHSLRCWKEKRVPAHKWCARMLRKGMMHTDKLGELIENQVKGLAGGVLDHGVERNLARRVHEPRCVRIRLRRQLHCAVGRAGSHLAGDSGYLCGAWTAGGGGVSWALSLDGALSPFGDKPVAFARKHLLGEEGLIVSCFSTGKDSRKNNMLLNLGRWLSLPQGSESADRRT